MDYEKIKRYDFSKPVKRMIWPLHVASYFGATADAKKYQTKYTKIGVDDLKGPYMILANHNAFLDFNILIKAIWPRRPNFIVAIDGFLKREGAARSLGFICKRKFTSDISVVKQMKRVIKNGDVIVMYPEARYSLCGTTAVLPESLGKLCKHLNIPIVTFVTHGHHINSPFYHLEKRGVKPTEAEMKLLFTPEDLNTLSVDEINAKIVEALTYNDYAWQKERGIALTYEKRAEGLNKVLYKCPCCASEFKISGIGIILKCESCQKEFEVTPLSEIKGVGFDAPFESIPDWYEWERACVKDEIEKGVYSTGTLKVHVESLPNPSKFISLGDGTMIHDMNGFRVEIKDDEGKTYTMEKSVPSLYSCHIEYDYLTYHKDCIDLNTLTDTWYVFPEGDDFNITKIALATEELYFDNLRKQGKPIKKGLA